MNRTCIPPEFQFLIVRLKSNVISKLFGRNVVSIPYSTIKIL